MHEDIDARFDFRSAAKSFFQNGGLDFELMLIARMLVVASAACPEIGAPGFDPMRGSLTKVIGAGTGESRFFLKQRAFDRLSLEDER